VSARVAVLDHVTKAYFCKYQGGCLWLNCKRTSQAGWDNGTNNSYSKVRTSHYQSDKKLYSCGGPSSRPGQSYGACGGQSDGFLSEFFGFALIPFHSGSPYSYTIWGKKI
jgi:hypothetical protein